MQRETLLKESHVAEGCDGGDSVDSSKKQRTMVVAPMGSHGREGLAPSEPGGSSSGWAGTCAARRAAGPG